MDSKDGLAMPRRLLERRSARGTSINEFRHRQIEEQPLPAAASAVRHSTTTP